jgi:transposase
MADGYLRGVDRDQELLLPSRVEDYVAPESEVRVIDAFAEGMSCGGEEDALPAERSMGLKGGRKGYAPRDLAKLFIWGYHNRVRSSRRLEKACRTNLEVIWLLGDLRPDHCSISRFRATHAGRIKGWLKHFNLIAAQAGLFGGEETAVDGTLLRAVNSKARNFTAGKLDKLEAKLEERVARYLDEPAANDAADDQQEQTAGALQDKIARVKELQQKYQALRREAKESPTGQVSLTDPEAVMLRKNAAAGSALVGFNAQSAVDGKHHLIAAVDVTNASHDKGHLAGMMKAARDTTGLPMPVADGPVADGAAPPAKCLADAGYKDYADIAATEALGFEPHVALSSDRGKGKPGLFPTADFRHDREANCYHCPAGAVLARHDDTRKRGTLYQSYYNVAACRACPLKDRCTKGRYRKIQRHEHQDSIDRMRQRMEQDPAAYKRRAALVEHPFGSMLFWSGARALLCRGLGKARAEFTLSALAYNLTRAMKVLGVAGLIQLIRAASKRPIAGPGAVVGPGQAAAAKGNANGPPGTNRAALAAATPNWPGLSLGRISCH